MMMAGRRDDDDDGGATLLPPLHRWSTQNNIFTGVLLGPWISFLWRYWWKVDWLHYWFRVMFITAMACLNTVLAVVCNLVYGRTIKMAAINERPVFIIGHPRTGTTLLHNMLALDKEQFHYPSTLAAGFSGAYLLLHPIRHLLKGVVSNTRPMDNMPLSLDTPQEDEIAINQMTGGVSQYGALLLMRNYRHFLKFLTMDGPTVSQNQKMRYTTAMLDFYKKLSFQGQGRRLLLKSPSHTAKVKLLLALFPKAQFIFIHRNPYEVFQSMQHMGRTTYVYSYLNRPSRNDVLKYTLSLYEATYDAYLDVRSSIPQANLVEVSFDELQRDKVATMRRIYSALGWGDAYEKRMAPVFAAYASTLKGYRKNAFKAMDPAIRALINQRWERSFRAFNYPIIDPSLDTLHAHNNAPEDDDEEDSARQRAHDGSRSRSSNSSGGNRREKHTSVMSSPSPSSGSSEDD